MTRAIIAILLALGTISGIATSANAHRPKPQPAAEQPFSPAQFWEQQQSRSG